MATMERYFTPPNASTSIQPRPYVNVTTNQYTHTARPRYKFKFGISRPVYKVN
jgi:hypothetical protein